jgi:flavodoxin
MKILILFETEAGTTQFVATLIKKHLNEHGQEADLHQASLDGLPKLEKYDGLIMGAPTYHHGQLPQHMADFLADFKPDLHKKLVAAYGLGDSMYPEYCTAADLLQDWLKSRGGVPTTEPLKIDGYPDDLEGLNRWVERTFAG